MHSYRLPPVIVPPPLRLVVPANNWKPVAVADVRLLFTLMVPAPVKECACAVVVGLVTPPLILRMPAVAPMAASAFVVTIPVTALVPERFSSCPPKLLPPTVTLTVVLALIVIAFGTEPCAQRHRSAGASRSHSFGPVVVLHHHAIDKDPAAVEIGAKRLVSRSRDVEFARSSD